MNYALLIYSSPAELALRNDPQKREAYWAPWPAYAKALADAGVMVEGASLQLPETATTVRLRDGQRLVQDGPYAETKEQLAGFFMIDVPDIEAAVEWAQRCPAARDSVIEIRPKLPPIQPNAGTAPANAPSQEGLQYTILIYESASDFAARIDPSRSEAYRAMWPPYAKALREAGLMAGGAGLELPATAVSLRLRDGQRLVHDGPYAETKEQLGGYFIIQAESLDVALEWAARCPTAATGVIEVRPNLVRR